MYIYIYVYIYIYIYIYTYRYSLRRRRRCRRAGHQSESVKGKTKEGELLSSGPAVCAGDSKKANTKEGKLLGLGSSENSSRSGTAVTDVTSTMFRKAGSSDQLVAPEEKQSNPEDRIDENVVVVMPRVALVKILEAVNVNPGNNENIHGDLLGASVENGKHKGIMLVRSVFVPDPDSDMDQNSCERGEWMRMRASPAQVLVGRLKTKGCIYIYIFIYIYVFTCCTYIYLYIPIYTYIYIYIYAHIYIYIYIYI